MSDHFRVIVGVPSNTTWLAEFGVDLVNLVASFTKKPVPGYKSQELRVVNVRSSILPKNRLNLVKAAQAAQATHILFLDSDHSFPPDLIHRLAKHKKMVVAANCVTKQVPANTTARAKSQLRAQGDPVYSDPDMHGLEAVWRVGTGVMLVAMSVFKLIGRGVWDMTYLPEADDYQGEDWSFCQACEKQGVPIFVDHDVSRLVGHIGNFRFTHDWVGEVKDGISYDTR